MTERLQQQLGPDAKKALALARRHAGKAPVLRRVKDLPGEARAMLVRPLIAGRPYEIRVGRGQERFLDHLVAHEVGHLVRLHRVPEEARLLPVGNAETRRIAVEQLSPYLVRLLELNVP